MEDKKNAYREEPISIPLTMEQWDTIKTSLKHVQNSAYGDMIWWRDFCVDKKLGAETAARHEATYNAYGDLYKHIEDSLFPPPPPEIE